MSSETTDSPTSGSAESMPNTVQTNWRWLVVAGAVIALIGVLAMFAPFVTGVSLSLLIGLFLIATGILDFVGIFRARRWTGAVWQLILGVVTLAAGVILLLNPVFGLVTLTLLVIAYLLVSGVIQTVMGFRLRGEPNWFLAIVSGVIGILLAVMLWAGFPSTALWAVGLLFGVNLLVNGVSMALLAYSARNMTIPAEMEQAAEAGGI
ncbi:MULTISPECIES: HdeD family acid-resistance protein [Haloferax]|uniref:HdeD family acid-resistance protein n=2 Tax=Haloferax TaxID=2251 RepID=A0A6G1Z791_9EURY|nr:MULTISPECIES: HdeD family acid-resistance protein [Haloferax]KAB1185167.1 HdeD family acid-resistance protein [Haloferax sp. CBA1149]MRW82345.1 HdeD family acid-resistance protein [Haloferax marinisediminis]